MLQNTRLGCLIQVLREHMLSPSRGKSHLSLLKSTSYPQGSPMGHLKESVLKLIPTAGWGICIMTCYRYTAAGIWKRMKSKSVHKIMGLQMSSADFESNWRLVKHLRVYSQLIGTTPQLTPHLSLQGSTLPWGIEILSSGKAAGDRGHTNVECLAQLARLWSRKTLRGWARNQAAALPNWRKYALPRARQKQMAQLHRSRGFHW